MQLTDTYDYSNINLANTWQSTILGEKRSCSKLVNIENLLPGVQELRHETHSNADTNSGDKTKRLTAMSDGIQSGKLKS
jgi:hypothetical protein